MADNYTVKNLEIRLKGTASELSNTFKTLQSTIHSISKEMVSFTQSLSKGNTQLENLIKTSNKLNTTLNQLKGQKDNLSFLNFKNMKTSDLDKADDTLKKVIKSTKELKKETENVKLGKVSVGYAEKTPRIPNYASRNTNSLTSLISNSRHLTSALSNMGSVFEKANDYVENFNLFSVAFKEGTDQSLQFHNSLERIAGVDISQSLRYGGEVKNLAYSLGLASKESNLLSENVTKLVYDISSLYNISMKSSHDKLMSGLVGQTKPLRSLGIDVTQQSLQPYLAKMGINEQVKSLTQAQKVMLRYIAILDQSKNAQGDFARTINNPANQMRILNETIAQTIRWVQTLGIQIIGGALPTLIGFASAVGEVVKFIAELLGFNIQDYKFVTPNTVAETYDMADAIESVGSGANNIGAGLGKASEKAKELRKELLGFDKINNLNSDTSVGSTGSLGGVGGGSLKGLGENLDITNKLKNAMKGYDNLLSSVQNKATGIKDSFMRMLGFTKEIDYATGELKYKWTQITPLVLGLGAIGTVKTIQGIIGFKNSLHGILDKFVQVDGKANIFQKSLAFLTTTTFGKFIAVGGAIAGTIGLIYGAIELHKWNEWNNQLNVFKGLSDDATQKLKPLVSTLEKAREINLKTSLGQGFIDESVLNTHITQIQSIINKYEDLRQKIIDVERDKIQAQIESGEIEKSIGEEKLKRLDNLYGYEQVKLKTLLNETQKILDDNKAKGGFLSEEEMAVIDRKYEEINRILLDAHLKMGGTIENFQKKYPNYIGGIIEETDLNHIRETTTKISTETDKLFLQMERSKLDSLDRTSATYEKERQEIQQHFEIARLIVDTNNKKINEIYEKASAEKRKLTKDEQAEIQGIYENGEKTIFEFLKLSSEDKAILNENFSRVTINQNKKWSEEVLKIQKETAKKEIDTINSKQVILENQNEQHNQRLAELQNLANERMLEDYEVAEQLKLNTQVENNRKEIEELEKKKNELQSKHKNMFSQIENDHQNHLNNVKSKREILSSQTYSELEKSGRFSKEQLSILKNALIRMTDETSNSALDSFGKVKNHISNGYNQLKKTLGEKLTINIGSSAFKLGFKNGSSALTNIGSIQAYHTGGFPNYGDMFIANERGAEMVGKIGNRTAVVNQQQIVESVSKGVANAVSQVLNGGRNSKQPINITVKIGDKTVENTIVEGLESALSKGYIPSL